MNVAYFRDWIEAKLAERNLDINSYIHKTQDK